VIALASNNMERVNIHLQKAHECHIPHEEVYEAILQIHLFAGYPASIEGLNALYSIYGPIDKSREEFNLEIFEQRGTLLCKEIYTTVFDKMMSRMTIISPDLARWMILDGYGKTLSRPCLDIQYRELINLVILALGQWRHQFISHLRGSLNIGISMEEILDSMSILQEEGTLSSYEFACNMIAEYKAA
jgi:alkylhydroperoxidase/carboxymuconolactone decarboxylase family protein YurZ